MKFLRPLRAGKHRPRVLRVENEALQCCRGCGDLQGILRAAGVFNAGDAEIQKGRLSAFSAGKCRPRDLCVKRLAAPYHEAPPPVFVELIDDADARGGGDWAVRAGDQLFRRKPA